MKKLKQIKNILKYAYFLAGFNPYKFYTALKRFYFYYKQRQFSPEEILLYNLVSTENCCQYKENIYSNEEYLTIQKRLNPAQYRHLTESKIEFDKLCQRKGIPTAKVFFYLEQQAQSTSTQLESKYQSLFSTLEDGNYLAKPSKGTHGQGIWTFTKNQEQFQINSTTMSLPQFCQYAMQICQNSDYLIQERIHQHQQIETFAPSKALQTLRFNTLIQNGKCKILFCEFRRAGLDRVTDNFNTGKGGSTIWTVNLEDGQVVRGYKVHQSGYGSQIVTPNNELNTDIAFMPCWQETLALVEKSALAFLPLKTIGWDVAITNTGPVLMEANSFFDPINFMADYNKEDIYQQLVAQV